MLLTQNTAFNERLNPVKLSAFNIAYLCTIKCLLRFNLCKTKCLFMQN